MIYKIQHKTLWDNDCEITITPAGGEADGAVTMLTGSAEPFEMETDDNTDIDTVIRATTGTLRFIVEDASVLDDIMPKTLLGTKVEVCLTKAGASESTCKFMGYIEMTEYSQPWDSVPYEMELPVRDALSLLEEMSMTLDENGCLCAVTNVAGVLVDAFSSAGVEPATLFFESSDYAALEKTIQKEWFIEKKSKEEDGVVTTAMQGMVWSDVLERVLRPLALTIWMDGSIIRLRCSSMQNKYFKYDWSVVMVIAQGGSGFATQSSVSQESLIESVTNMSAGNTVGYLPAARSVSVGQSIDDRSVFELDNDFLTWKLNSMNYHSSGDSVWEWHGETTQRGVTLSRGYIDEDKAWYDMSVDEAVSYRFNGRPVYGGVLCDLAGYKTEDAPEQDELPKSNSPSVVFPIMDAQDDVDVSYDDLWNSSMIERLRFLDFTCPVLIETAKSGCLCLNATLKLSDAGSLTPYYAQGVAETKDTGTMVFVQVEMTNVENGNMYRWFPQSGWSQEDSYKGYMAFDGNGSLVMNAFNRNVTIAYREGGEDKTMSWNYGEGAVKIAERFRYKGIEGLIMPLSDFPEKGLFKMRVSFIALTDSNKESTIESEVAHRILYHNGTRYFESLGDIKVTWCPECVNGELPEPGESSGGSYNARYVDVPEAMTKIFDSGNDAGDDLEVDLETWGDSDGLKWGNTVQPNIFDSDAWNGVCRQFFSTRKSVEYDNAVLEESVPSYFEYNGETFACCGGTWQSWDEGGRKKLVQVI